MPEQVYQLPEVLISLFDQTTGRIEEAEHLPDLACR